MNDKNKYSKIKDYLLNPYFLTKQKIRLRILRIKDKKEKIGKFLYLFYADMKNNENYEPTVLYLKLLMATSIIMSFVVFGYKHNNYSVLLGTSIAVTIALAQYYIEWYLKLIKKYR